MIMWSWTLREYLAASTAQYFTSEKVINEQQT